jgi:hypothetical protein
MPRFRITVLRMMVAVAIVGMMIGAVEFRNRSRAFRERAAIHRTLARVIWQRCCFENTLTAEGQREHSVHIAFNERYAAHHESLARNYDYAACYPWLAVLPDSRDPNQAE